MTIFGTPSSINLSAPPAGTITYAGPSGSKVGRAVAFFDWRGTGQKSDLGIGADLNTHTGGVYVVYDAGGNVGSVALATLNSSLGCFVAGGQPYDDAGSFISAVDNFPTNGQSGVLIGADFAPAGAVLGRNYLIKTPFSLTALTNNTLSLENIPSGMGTKITTTNNIFVARIASFGNFTGGGNSSFLGGSWFLQGGSPLGDIVNLPNVLDGVRGVLFNPDAATSQSAGYYITAATLCDVSGAGKSSVLASYINGNQGKILGMKGTASLNATMDITKQGPNSLSIAYGLGGTPPTNNNQFGLTLDCGKFNTLSMGLPFQDLIIGTTTTETYVLFGNSALSNATIPIYNTTKTPYVSYLNGTNGVTIQVGGTGLARAIPDMDQDGLNEFLIGQGASLYFFRGSDLNGTNGTLPIGRSVLNITNDINNMPFTSFAVGDSGGSKVFVLGVSSLDTTFVLKGPAAPVQPSNPVTNSTSSPPSSNQIPSAQPLAPNVQNLPGQNPSPKQSLSSGAPLPSNPFKYLSVILGFARIHLFKSDLKATKVDPRFSKSEAEIVRALPQLVPSMITGAAFVAACVARFWSSSEDKTSEARKLKGSEIQANLPLLYDRFMELKTAFSKLRFQMSLDHKKAVKFSLDDLKDQIDEIERGKATEDDLKHTWNWIRDSQSQLNECMYHNLHQELLEIRAEYNVHQNSSVLYRMDKLEGLMNRALWDKATLQDLDESQQLLKEIRICLV